MRKDRLVKKTLKKPYKFLKKATIAMLLANGVFLGQQGYVAYRINENNDKTNSQILEDAKVFNSDLENYFKDIRNAKNTRRLAHNGNEPIYVQLSGGFSDNEINKIKESFGYIENIFKDINPSYRFKFVDNNLLNTLMGKVTINVSANNKISGEGRAFVKGHNVFRSDYLVNAKIQLKTEEAGHNHGFEEVVLHEILHLFQMGDLYVKDIGKEISTSAIYVDIFVNEVPELTPQDYRALNALYNNTYIENGVVNKDKIAKTLNLINTYEQNYYSVRADLLRDYSSANYNYQNLTTKNTNNLNVVLNRLFYDVNVQLNNGEYNFIATEKKTGKTMSSHKGSYVVTNGVVVLKEVETENNMFVSNVLGENKRISDIMLVQIDAGEFAIIDVANITTKSIINKNKLDFDLVELRNRFFENKLNHEKTKQNAQNTFVCEPTGQMFSIMMDEEKDTLSLFR